MLSYLRLKGTYCGYKFTCLVEVVSWYIILNHEKMQFSLFMTVIWRVYLGKSRIGELDCNRREERVWLAQWLHTQLVIFKTGHTLKYFPKHILVNSLILDEILYSLPSYFLLVDLSQIFLLVWNWSQRLMLISKYCICTPASNCHHFVPPLKMLN